MRGDATLQARLLLRGSGLAGAVVVAGGLLGLAGAYRSWYAVAAELTMLDERQARAVAHLAGWAAHPWAWLVPALSLAAVALGAAIAVDRPPAHTRDLLLTAGGLLGVAVGLGALLRPGVNRFDVAGTRLRELVDLADRLPDGVELGFSVALTDGVWLTLGGAVLIVAGTIAARELH